jgi:S-methylmethionine-dependent homocysteine/selenocysteine methylase
MSVYRNDLPQLSGDICLTDGGLETTLVFHEGIDLPEFAAFDLMKDKEGQEALTNYLHPYVDIAKKYEFGFILESVTWRASSSWGKKIGYSDEELFDVNNRAIQLLADYRKEHANDKTWMVISGCIGPRGDGYNPEFRMTEDEAEEYHSKQVSILHDTQIDMLTALTLNYIEEAIGITRAAQKYKIPVVISFTVETDGRLPSGETLKEAIERVDNSTGNGPIYYMINCAHPTHFESSLNGESWVERIRGIRANASSKSHEELDNSTELDDGNPQEFGQQYRTIRDRYNHINVFGGCCGTDHRHIEEICRACF